jgi:hypothetical protein
LYREFCVPIQQVQAFPASGYPEESVKKRFADFAERLP